MKKFIVAATSVALSVIAAPSFASTDSVVSGCAGGGNCVSLVTAEIGSYTGSAAEKDRKIAALVAALANASTGSNKAGISQAISYAGGQSSSTQQRQQIASIADTVNNCSTTLGSCQIETASNGPTQAGGNGNGGGSNVTSSNGGNKLLASGN